MGTSYSAIYHATRRRWKIWGMDSEVWIETVLDMRKIVAMKVRLDEEGEPEPYTVLFMDGITGSFTIQTPMDEVFKIWKEWRSRTK